MNPTEHKSETPKCLHCDKTLDVKAPPAETVCENCGAHGVIKKSETPEGFNPLEKYPTCANCGTIHQKEEECPCLGPEDFPLSETPETDAVSFTAAPEFADEYSPSVVSIEFARKLELERDQARRERDEAREENQNRRNLDIIRLESDSISASCNCLTKSPDIKHHKIGCKYRIIYERDQLRARIGEWETKLTALGDLAVSDWNDPIVGEVDKLIPSQTQKKYSEVLRDLFVTIPARAKELEKDKERLIDALQRCLNVAYENPDDWRVQIGQAVDKAMKCSQPTSEHLAATPNIAPNIPATNEEQE